MKGCSEIEEVDSVISYIKYIKEFYHSINPKKHLFFRGHSRISYELIPSVLRGNLNEKDIILDFQQYAPQYNINFDFVYDCDKVLGYMQHYGIPTRLIDWSINPLVALYFACKESNDDVKEDGRIFIFNPWKYNSEITEYEEPEAHKINILARSLLSYNWNLEVIQEYLQKKFINVTSFLDNIDKPFSFVSEYTNKRKISQQGCFTIHGANRGAFDKWDEAKKSICYLTIKGKKKEEILEELNLLYVNEYSIFPDFEGMSKMLNKWGSLFNWNKNE